MKIAMRDSIQRRYLRRQRQAGVSLIELLVVLAMSTAIAVSLSFAYGSALKLQESNEAQKATYNQTNAMELELQRTLEGARLNGVPVSSTTTLVGSESTYFQGIADGGQGEEGSDRITFTTTAPSTPMAAMNDTDDFLTQQQTRGPIGGLEEVSIGLTPVGEAGEKTGLFERIQQPCDSDPTQGGMESDLDSDIATIGFEFWDGEEWDPTWDTTQMTTPELPEAVQVTYTIKNESGSPQHVFVVPIYSSTVNPNNPLPGGTSTTTGTTTP